MVMMMENYRSSKRRGCPYNGNCDICALPDCDAGAAQIFNFYAREERETSKKYGSKRKRKKNVRSKRKE